MNKFNNRFIEVIKNVVFSNSLRKKNTNNTDKNGEIISIMKPIVAINISYSLSFNNKFITASVYLTRNFQTTRKYLKR